MILTAYLIGVALCGAIVLLVVIKDRNVVRYWTDMEKLIMSWVLAVIVGLSWLGVTALVIYSMLTLIKTKGE